tara:strand:+ start:1052 stop:2266 length:1215 start_codon:yes stop_codon:yes gene_type:complete
MAKLLPTATNRLSTEETYFLRKFYKDQAFPDYGPKSIDFWYDKGLYGRIDRDENAVVPKTTSVRQIPSAKGTHFALDFVADAFVGMRNAFDKGMMMGNVRARGSVYSGLRVARGIESSSQFYHNYLQIVDKSFLETHLDVDGKMSEIKNFQDYFREYIKYLQDRLPFIPITKSSFITSKYAPPSISGLVIEINGENHAKDLPKKEAYIDDPNFDIFRNTAQQFGFMVDTNAPWRLTADLASPFMQRFGEKYDVLSEPGSASNVFDTHYDLVYTEDVKMLRRFFQTSYEVFTEKYPTLNKVQLTSCKDTTPIFDVKEHERQFPEDVSFEKEYTDSFWAQLYMNIRMGEMGISLTERRKRVIIKETVDRIPFVGFEKTVKDINTKMISMNPNRWWFGQAESSISEY